MDLQIILNQDKYKEKEMALSGMQYCNSLAPTYQRASLELSWLISDPAIGLLLAFVFHYRSFHDQCLAYSQNPTEANKEILQKFYIDLNKSYDDLK